MCMHPRRCCLSLLVVGDVSQVLLNMVHLAAFNQGSLVLVGLHCMLNVLLFTYRYITIVSQGTRYVRAMDYTYTSVNTQDVDTLDSLCVEPTDYPEVPDASHSINIENNSYNNRDVGELLPPPQGPTSQYIIGMVLEVMFVVVPLLTNLFFYFIWKAYASVHVSTDMSVVLSRLLIVFSCVSFVVETALFCNIHQFLVFQRYVRSLYCRSF